MRPRLRSVLVGVASLADLSGQLTIGELRRARAAGASLDTGLVGATQAVGFVAVIVSAVVSVGAAVGVVPAVLIWAAVSGPVSFIAATVALTVSAPSAR